VAYRSNERLSDRSLLVPHFLQQEEIANHVHVFVGDLPPDVTDSVLLAAFQGCRGCSTARVMWDHATGRSRGYGFVSFRTQEEAEEAIQTMHGQFVGARRVRCGWAQHKMESALPMDATVLDRVDPTNTNVYIGNLAPHVSDADVRRAFVSFGPIAEVKLHRKGSFGFVRYKAHEDAVRAILGMNGAALGGKTLKCSWGRHPNMPPSGVKASLMLAAAAGVAPLGLAGGAPMGTGRGAMMPPMSMLGGGGMLGMPMAATGAQGVVQGQGMGQVGMGLGMGLGGQNMQTPEGVPSMDPVHSMYALPAGYGMTPHYGGMGQVFYHGQQHPQSGGM